MQRQISIMDKLKLIDRISDRDIKFLSSGRKGGNYPYAVSLALDTIDFFRNITRLDKIIGS